MEASMYPQSRRESYATILRSLQLYSCVFATQADTESPSDIMTESFPQKCDQTYNDDVPVDEKTGAWQGQTSPSSPFTVRGAPSSESSSSPKGGNHDTATNSLGSPGGISSDNTIVCPSINSSCSASSESSSSGGSSKNFDQAQPKQNDDAQNVEARRGLSHPAKLLERTKPTRAHSFFASLPFIKRATAGQSVWSATHSEALNPTDQPKLNSVARCKLDAEQCRDAWLNGFSGWHTAPGSWKSACMAVQAGQKESNQDAAVVWENPLDTKYLICGVFDGHGPDGEAISDRARCSLPYLIFRHHEQLALGEADWEQVTMKEDESRSREELWREAHEMAFQEVERDVRLHPRCDPFLSGTTAVTAVVDGDLAVVANVGDSRCVLGYSSPDGSLCAQQLSFDHKPSVPEEKQRIQARAGRVFSLKNECSSPALGGRGEGSAREPPERVWLPNEDSPGIAMSRSIGDALMKEFGLSAEPHISTLRILPHHHVLVLASDGVWDVLDDLAAVEIALSVQPRRDEAAALIVKAASKRWRAMHGRAWMDDMAVVVVFLSK